MSDQSFSIRKRTDRGHINHGWLDTWHSFSFGEYHDPAHMGFRSLRVINEDWVAAGHGFGMHPHRDMEIITHVLEGELEHRDSMGNGSVIRAGDWQHMTAGTGIYHSESNPSPTVTTHLYQIWIFPERRGLQPSYSQVSRPGGKPVDGFQLVAGPEGGDGILTIRQDARLLFGRLASGAVGKVQVDPKRAAWVQVLRGKVRLEGHDLEAGDGVAIGQSGAYQLHGSTGAEVLWFDLV